MIRAAVAATLLIANPAIAEVHGPAPAQISVCFVPAQSCTPEVVAAIGTAQKTIRVQAYGFTSPPILAALAKAASRGVEVLVILDKSNDRTASGKSPYSGATFMTNAGIPVWIDDKPAIAHNKVMVVDDHLVVGGSFNYTLSADRRNAENVTFTDSPEVARWFSDNWKSRLAASRVFSGPSEEDVTGSIGGAE